MNLTALVWGLWIISGGPLNSGYLSQPQVAAYFKTQADCERTMLLVGKLSKATDKDNVQPNAMQCIQAEYVVAK